MEAKKEGKRKVRSDKGLILLTERDGQCLAWIADQYAVRLDQIQRLLSRSPGGPLIDPSLGLAAATVKDQVNRWQKAGWIEYQRVLADGRGWAWITRRGLELLAWDDKYTARVPAFTRLEHIYAVNQVRLFMDTQEGTPWKSERAYRAGLSCMKKGTPLGPIPDAVIERPRIGKVAVEVELTAKKPDDLERKLEALVEHRESNASRMFQAIWFYVPDEKMKHAIERGRERLEERDQRRVSVAIQRDMRMT